MKGFKFPWRENVRKKERNETERVHTHTQGERENDTTRTTMYLLNVKRNYNFIAYGI